MRMESKKLSFADGLVSYDLNGKFELTFNPTDSAFVERLFNTFDALDKKQEEYRAEVEKADRREVFEIARKRDAEMRDMIDSALDAPVCDAVFGRMNVYALADGLPAWANLLLAIMDEIDTSFSREQKQTNIRIRKYSEKYKRK
jgi:hypothetical protein